MKTTIIPETWKNSQREDLSQAQTMVDLGFEIEYNVYDARFKRIENPIWAVSFTKGTLYVWKVKGWVSADIINGHFCNHKHYESINEFIESLK